MRILWVNSGLGKTFSNTRLFGIPPALKSLGDDSMVLIAGKADGDLPDYFHPLPVPFGRLRLYRLLLTLILPILCFKYRPDILLSDWMSAKLIRLAVLLRRLGLLSCKFVHDVRTVPVKDDGGKSWEVYAGSLEYAKAHFDGITTITEPLRGEIHRHFGINEDKIAVWTSGVDIEHFRPRDALVSRREMDLDEKIVLFYHGNVQPHRGLVELIEAMDLLRDLSDLRLLIVGGGHEWGRLEKLVLEKSLHQVILKPGVPYDQIPMWIACADLCVLPLPDHPWWRVSSPLKLMEYLAMGKPILLTDMQAHRAVLRSDADAFYVPRCHPQDFATGIRRALQERHRFEEMGLKGRRRAEEELTWHKQATVLRDYLTEVLNGGINLRDGRL